MTDIGARVREIIAKELGIGIAEVEDDVTLKSLGADSLDAVVIAVDIEDAFKVAIDDDAIEEAQTVGAAIAVVERVLGDREAA